MKSGELIKKLKEVDPTGELEVSLGGDVVDIYTLPWYYDGRVRIFIRDENGEVVGIRQATEKDGSKIVIETKDWDDFAWEEEEHKLYDGNPREECIVEGDDYFKDRYQKYKLEARETMKEILNKTKL